VDPHKGAKAISGVAEAKRLGLVGLAFHPAVQRFDPSDRRLGSIWEVAEELDLVVLVHTGSSAFGAGEPGGTGVDLSFGDPMLMDRVAADYPGLRIVLAHSSRLWLDRTIAIARHKANVWVDLAGWSPKRLPADLLDAVRGPLTDVVLFGSGHPFGDVDGWLSAWDGLGMTDEVTERVLAGNASRLLRLDGQSS
ncbi:MAG: amidohydrolase family protein, partial [Acidimicrobiia bacterium]|nr:amidohydrolase family protein [Acidimicrobiia bacterium]